MKGKLQKMIAMIMLPAMCILAGCGGGGGTAGVTTQQPTGPTSTSVSIKSGAKKVSDTLYTPGGISTPANSTINGLVEIDNTDTSKEVPSTATISLNLPVGISLDGSSVQVIYKNLGVDTPMSLSANIASPTGVPIGVAIPPSSSIFVKYNATVSANVASGYITTAMLGQTSLTTITVTNTTCVAPVNPTCGNGTHLVSGGMDANNCAVAGTCVTDQATCQALNTTCGTGYHYVPGGVSANGCAVQGYCQQDGNVGPTCPNINTTCAAGTHYVSGGMNANGCAVQGTCVQNACTAINQPVCTSGTHFVAGNNDGNGCPTLGTCAPDQSATPGTITANATYKGADVRIAGICLRSTTNSAHDICPADTPFTQSMPADSYYIDCGTWSGHTVTPSHTKTSPLVLASGNSKAMSCTYGDYIGPTDGQAFRQTSTVTYLGIVMPKWAK